MAGCGQLSSQVLEGSDETKNSTIAADIDFDEHVTFSLCEQCSKFRGKCQLYLKKVNLILPRSFYPQRHLVSVIYSV